MRTILEHAEELAHLQTLETSIPLAQARGMHVPRTAENFGFFADMLASLSGESYEQSGAYLAIVTREPVGTALLIAPWNAPLTARAAKLRIGDPFDAHTEIGPMAFKAHYDRLLAFAGTAQTDPAYKVLTGARAAPGFEAGYYFAPTVVETHDNMTELCQQELFGPFAVIQRVDDLEDAIARANQSEFGLAAYIWADDLPTVMRARRLLRAGTIWVNTPMARDLRAPFGGYKQSGIGRDGLPGSIELFTEEKSTLIPNAPLTLPKLGMGS